MTTEQYDWAQQRIIELQNPALQPIGLALSWELNDLMTDCARYEESHDQEASQDQDDF